MFLLGFHVLCVSAFTKGSGPPFVAGLHLAMISNKLYSFGGGDVTGSVYNFLFSFDTSSNTWSPKVTNGEIPEPRCDHGFTSAQGGKLFAFGGRAFFPSMIYGDMFVFDTIANSWSKIEASGPTPSARYSMGFTSTPDGQVYVFGGTDGSVELGDLYKYDPSTNSWNSIVTTGFSPSPRSRMGFAAVPDGKIFMFGGASSNTPSDNLADFACFDPVSGTWTSISPSGPLPAARMELGLTSTADGKLYLFGGQSSIVYDYGDFWQFDPAANSWSQVIVPGSPSARQAFGFASSRDGMIFVYGGYYYDQYRYLGDFYRFDSVSMEWVDCNLPTVQSCVSCPPGYYYNSSGLNANTCLNLSQSCYLSLS